MTRTLPALVALALMACGAQEPELGVVRLKTGLWEDQDILEFHHRILYSQCVLDGLANFSQDELEAWQETFCEREVHISSVNCSSAEVDFSEDRYVFKFYDPIDRTDETDFIIGPIPTPESMGCDPYIELAGIYFRTPKFASATGSLPGAEFRRARADGSRY